MTAEVAGWKKVLDDFLASSNREEVGLFPSSCPVGQARPSQQGTRE